MTPPHGLDGVIGAPRHPWEQRFKELEAFKKEHGHCNVPRSYPLNQQLAYWVDSVRQRKKGKRRGKLDKETIRRLDELGFCWSLLHRRFHRRDLDELVAILRAFKKRHGHCNLIAAHEGVEPDLLDWLKDVRKSKKHGRLDPRYVRQLERLGFVWRPKERNRQEMYSALLDYRKRYGDCRVPSHWPKNRRLASWVERMRASKRRNKLTHAQIQELDRIGFIWNIDPHYAWEQRFRELKAFKKKHRHCNVPWNSSLGCWVSRMRQRKKHGTLAKERVRRLAALGFCWVTKRHGLPRRHPQIAEESTGRVRFSARSVKAQRKRLGLSCLNYGKLVGVSGPTIYYWESGKSRPRKAPLARFVAVRGIGKREATKRLKQIEARAKKG